jgi:hypothetical protein
MAWRLAADAVVVLHLAFVVFAVAGGLLVLRWRWIALPHLAALAWAAYVEFSGRICPLTPLENALRAGAGEAAYAGGFVEHYLLPVLYPAALTRELQSVLGAGLLAFNAAVYAAVAWQVRRKLTGTRSRRRPGS